MADPRSYLLVLGEREAIRWVVTSGQMAFPATPRREVAALRAGDQLLLVSTRGAFHNPARDRTRVIGTATVGTAVEALEQPVELAGRLYTKACSIEMESLTPYLEGLEFAPLTDRLDTFRGRSHWGMLLRRPLVLISDADAEVIRKLLSKLTSDLAQATAEYSNRIAPVRPHPRPTLP